MNECWKQLTVTSIRVAVYVSPNTGKHVHKNRPFHGFVLNDEKTVRDYIFDDGRVMRTEENSLFYLPKGSSYYVKNLCSGGCYAINFDAEISDLPFSIPLYSAESLLHSFRAAADAWRTRDDMRHTLAMRAVYEAVLQIQREWKRRYVSGKQGELIRPAVEMMLRDFTRPDLNIADLAALCDISEVYFRRLFFDSFGVSPKEYLIGKRMEYAKALLRSEQFSVSEVASLCGYAEPCHFSREFSRRVGTSPRRYMETYM